MNYFIIILLSFLLFLCTVKVSVHAMDCGDRCIPERECARLTHIFRHEKERLHELVHFKCGTDSVHVCCDDLPQSPVTPPRGTTPRIIETTESGSEEVPDETTSPDDRKGVVSTTRSPPATTSPGEIEILTRSHSAPQGNINRHKNIGLINDKYCGLYTTVKITGGVEAGLHQFPWLGLLQYRTSDDEKRESFKCSGTLISPNTVLTAAHCIQRGNEELFSVRFGEHNTRTAKDCYNHTDPTTCQKGEVEDYPIQSIILHANYDSETKENDIAIIHLTKSVELFKTRVNVRTICLPVKDTQQIDNVDEKYKNLTIAGWGTTEYNTDYNSPVLMFAIVQYMEQNDCENFYARKRIEHVSLTLEIRDKMMCAGGKAKVDTCRGDSGGSLQGLAEMKKERHRMFQHGIVSAGVQCSYKIPFPGVYTRVTKYLSWILDNLASPSQD